MMDVSAGKPSMQEERVNACPHELLPRRWNMISSSILRLTVITCLLPACVVLSMGAMKFDREIPPHGGR
jgi:hypothetical protein